jgi:hypothetical protein
LQYHFLKINNFDQHFDRILLFWQLHLQLANPDELKLIRQQLIGQELIEIHRTLAIKKGELGRWLTLFRQTLQEFQLDEPDLAKVHELLFQLWNKKLDFFEHQFDSAFFSGPA